MEGLRSSEFRAMGTDVQIAILPEANHRRVHKHLQHMQVEILRLEQMMSRFVPHSDVNLINQRPGSWVDVHPETRQVIQCAIDGFHESQGRFNPCMGAMLESYGYDRSFHLGLDAADSDVLPAPSPCDFLAIPLCLSDEGRVQIHPGYKLDLGGIAKGWIIEHVGRLLQGLGYRNFVINAGGDMVCSGDPGADGWQIGIVNPLQPSQHVLTVSLASLCIATSGTYRRRWRVGGEERHHILDPMTGAPSTSDVVSCSVIHPSLVRAEIMAKVGLLLGADAAVAWLSAQSQGGWVVISKEGKVVHSWKS